MHLFLHFSEGRQLLDVVLGGLGAISSIMTIIPSIQSWVGSGNTAMLVERFTKIDNQLGNILVAIHDAHDLITYTSVSLNFNLYRCRAIFGLISNIRFVLFILYFKLVFITQM